MPNNCRDVLDRIPLNTGQNAALLLARYLKKDGAAARDELLDAAVSAVGRVAEDIYGLAFKRRGAMLGGTSGTFKLAGRMIIGLGTSNVLEAGLTLNPIYGTPLIPGSALKGLAAHYCSKIWGESDVKFKGPVSDRRGNIATPAGEYYQLMFGITEDAGFITFHDAWITPPSRGASLAREVITPHHQGYYMSGDDRCAPTDFDSPVPVTFLAVKGEFEIRVNCEGGDKDWEYLALELLEQALENWGVGGKTNSGYGCGELVKSSGAGSATSSSPVSGLASLLTPGQKIEARVAGINKKGNPQFDAIFHDGKEIKISGKWDGAKREWKKGDRVNAAVKGYSQNDNPPLTLTD